MQVASEVLQAAIIAGRLSPATKAGKSQRMSRSALLSLVEGNPIPHGRLPNHG
jgi:hypothetical protein